MQCIETIENNSQYRFIRHIVEYVKYWAEWREAKILSTYTWNWWKSGLFWDCIWRGIYFFLKRIINHFFCICLTPRRHSLGHIEAVLLGQIKCCHTGIMGVALHEYPTQSQYTHTGPTSINLGLTWEKSLLTINSAAGRIRTRDPSIPSPRHYQWATDHPIINHT